MREDTKNTTRYYIIQSLIKLMHVKTFDEITMEEISVKSGMSRRTVYRYFNNKLAVLRAYVDDLMIGFRMYIQTDDEPKRNTVEKCFEYINQNYEFFQAAYRNDLMVNIMDILREAVNQIVDVTLDSMDVVDYREQYVSYVAGGIWGMLWNWLITDVKLNPHEMYLLYKKFAFDLNLRLGLK